MLLRWALYTHSDCTVLQSVHRVAAAAAADEQVSLFFDKVPGDVIK